jgi:hypothetical protein
MSKEIVAPQVKRVVLSIIVEDLRNGLTKWKKDDIGFGSIEKKYNLLHNEALELFSHPKIKNLEHRIPTFIIEDDLSEPKPEPEPLYVSSTEKKESITVDVVKPKQQIVTQQITEKQEAFI